MRIFATLSFFLFATTFFPSLSAPTAHAQTGAGDDLPDALAPTGLAATLAAEDVSALAKAAREKGDAVRGAILYSQKKLNCAGCHQPRATDLLGPDLSQIGPEIKDEHFVESILKPSKEIKKGFESVKVLTLDGRVLVGRVIEDRSDTMVLREHSEAGRLVRLPKNDVDEVVPNTISTMPADLANQLADRQQFLDLVKYLMDIAATGGQSESSPTTLGGGEVKTRLKGLALIDQFRCVRCHSGETGNDVPAAQAPVLALAASRIDPRYVRRFIADPLHVKPGTSMPDVMSQLSESSRNDAAEAIEHYLRSLTDTPFQRQPLDQDAASRGHELFHSVGCVACHSPRDDSGSELLTQESVPLGELVAKYGLDGLASFLEDPHATRPSGRMPNLMLTHWEAIDVANYLLQGSEMDESPMEPADPSLVESGRKSFVDLRCANCHVTDDKKRAVQSVPLANLRMDQGCLSTDPIRSVHFAMNESQRTEITAALRALPDPLSDREQINLTMQTFRCFSCHQRGELGGVSDARDLYFHSQNENLGPQGRIPPTLTGVGAKLKPKWLRQVLVSGRTIRPYVKTRMPQYGATNIGHLVDLLSNTDKLPSIEHGQVADAKEAKKVGTDLVGRGGLNCVACHTFQQKPAQTMPAVDLTEMSERLQRTWFEHYMRRPQSLSPGTVMPSFWPGGKAIRKEILDGDTDQQISAIWEYLLDGRQARTPRGLDIKPIELLAGSEAVMLRRNYQGIGKRGIGVGYPGEVNLAFDAEQMRLAMIWRGPFADPGGAWRGQGAGTVRPLSRTVLRFAAGPELDDANTPWVVDEGRPPRHKFTGYFLDELQRPAFTYRFDDVEVEDYTINTDAGIKSVGLKRTIKMSTAKPKDGIVFRLGSGESIEQIDERSFRLNGSLQITIDKNHRAEIKNSDGAKLLLVPLRLEAGSTELVIEYAW